MSDNNIDLRGFNFLCRVVAWLLIVGVIPAVILFALFILGVASSV